MAGKVIRKVKSDNNIKTVEINHVRTGRPRIFSSPQEFESKAIEYFKKCEETDEKPRICGLALAVGLSGRKSLCVYQNREEYRDVVEWAKGVVEDSYESDLRGKHMIGAIFALKQFGWSDRPPEELEMSNNIASAISAAIRASTETKKSFSKPEHTHDQCCCGTKKDKALAKDEEPDKQ